ncbi:MAG TPA: ubiquinol-cytochrome c reductase iron-sulfur subunit [Hyphomicrobium sp.]|nr:ubiquinol-cytochrome c reductase iron-sulfur subunit [Hyphomicrobium sp.]
MTKAKQTADETASAKMLTRRRFAQGLAVCGCAAAAARAGRARADGDPVPTLQKGDRFAIVPESGDPAPIKLDELKPGQAIMGGYPVDPATGKARTETRLNMINVVRLSGDHKSLAATNGVAVFSAICTHKGCAVASWQPDVNHWRCFCHMSEFDAAAKGDVVAGPATDPLPMIPIAVDAEGYIVAADSFSAAPGAQS